MENSYALLDKYNALLTDTIKDLKANQQALKSQIENSVKEEEELGNRILEVEERLEFLKNSIEEKRKLKEDYEKAIEDTQTAYSQIIQSSKNMLGVLRKECDNFKKDTD